MIKILDLNDNSRDIEIGTANIDRVYGGRGGKKVAGASIASPIVGANACGARKEYKCLM